MSTLKRFKHDSIGYFDDLPKGTRELIRELILEAAADRHGPEGYKNDNEAMDDIECHSRDGFIASSYNKGGLVYRNFADLMDYYGGGYGLAHVAADIHLDKMIQGAISDAYEAVYDNHKALCLALNIEKEDCNYNSLEQYERTSELLSEEQRKEVKKMIRECEDSEYEGLQGDHASVMHEFRVMYHGKEDGLHSASISAAVNLEAPYHRSSISWAPNVFCEGAKEVEITWKNQAELKRKLAKALKQVSKAVF